MNFPPFNLEGAAIRLVPLAAAHLNGLCEIGLDPQLWRATTIQVRTREEMETYIARALDAETAGTALPFTIIEAKSGKIIGTTRYHTIVAEHKRLEIGFTWIALPWQRTAVNTEAKYLMLRHAFETWGYIRVEFRADTENEQSRRSLTRIGAIHEGNLRSYRISQRGIRDLAVFRIIATEWPKVRLGMERKLNSET